MTESYRRSGDDSPQTTPYVSFGAPGAYPPPPPYAPPAPPAEGAPRRRMRRPVALIAAVALASGLIGGGSAALIASATQGGSSGQSTAVVNAGATTGNGVSSVAKAVGPAIVEIKARTTQGESTGSGVVITGDGEIITNNHVVSGAGTVSVSFSDGSTRTAEVVGTDPGKDLALIKVKGAKNLTHATLGDSSKLAVGDQVVAIGSPEGLTGSVTSGIVSALGREVTVPKEDQGQQQQQQQGQGDLPWPFEFGGNQYNGDTGSSTTSYKAIQTDASLNPGNSGGALIDMQGRIIGINSAMYSPSDATSSSAGSVGLGFAIPINTVKADLDTLRAGGSGN
ncbi:S1C family serine protease [Streptomyces purpurogeneiscleroticus]|uniref:S1C family serine protease n=1 Tax=Streptomyces purpurogeneiscleroticus TaxID=68259 RepID=UPI001CBBB15B|nr:trypsin-like peptidase domain-containing protein [Streptomyces purpurogeneiscleroticus]MBZ4017921.1 serine protease [Streptomyces purpurogeneiscleroticus]